MYHYLIVFSNNTLVCSFSLSLARTHTCTHTHTHTHTHSLSLPGTSYWYPYTFIPSLSFSLSLSHTHTHTSPLLSLSPHSLSHSFRSMFWNTPTTMDNLSHSPHDNNLFVTYNSYPISCLSQQQQWAIPVSKDTPLLRKLIMSRGIKKRPN